MALSENGLNQVMTVQDYLDAGYTPAADGTWIPPMGAQEAEAGRLWGAANVSTPGTVDQIKSMLKQVSDAAGLPSFDWTPYVTQFADQNSGAWNLHNTAWGNNLAKIVDYAAAANPQLQQVAQQVKPELIAQGNQIQGSLYTANKNAGGNKLLDTLKDVGQFASNPLSIAGSGTALGKLNAIAADIPGSPASLDAAVAKGNWSNPLSSEQNAWDIIGGGASASENPTVRTVGRTVGAGIGLAGLAGALSAPSFGTGLTAGEAATGAGAAPLGTGITAGGGAAGSIGGGALGTGLTATAAEGGLGAGLAAGGGAGIGGGSLGTGLSLGGLGAAGTSLGGATGLSGTLGGGTMGTTAASGTALQRILDGTATTADYLQLAGQVGPGLLQMYGANQQQNALQNVANQYLAMGAPYRQTLADITNDPSKFYSSQQAQLATDAVLRRLSAGGNPGGNPYAQAQTINALFGEYGKERDRLAGYGGLTQYNSAAPQAAQNAIGATGGIYSGLGSAIGNVLNPQSKSLADLLKGVTI